MPKTLLIKGIRFSAIANNVAIPKKWVPNIDPESFGFSSDNLVGLESTADNALIRNNANYTNPVGATLNSTEAANYYLTKNFVDYLRTMSDPRLGSIYDASSAIPALV